MRKKVSFLGHQFTAAFVGALAGIAAGVVAALVLSILAATGHYVPTSPAQVMTPRAQAHAAEQAAVTPNPNCPQPAPAQSKLGACAPVQAVAAAQAQAPLGTSATVGAHGSQTASGPLAFLTPSTAQASGPVDRGEDVSSYQGCSINWAARTSYVHWAGFKNGQGNYYTDACLRHNVASAKQAGLPYTTYHFEDDRVSPTQAADREASTDKSVGATGNGFLGGTLDTETNPAGLSSASHCGQISAYLRRYMQDTHTTHAFLYSSSGTYAGCVVLPAGTLLWDAAYGPAWNILSGFPYATAWQFSDGQLGPTPHLDGGDSDIWLGSHQSLLALASPQPQPKPIAYPYWQACSQLDAITWFKQHSKQHSVSPGQHAQAVSIRKRLTRAHLGCSAMPHSYPYHLPKRKGALA